MSNFWFILFLDFAEPVSKPALHFRPMMGDVAEGQEIILVCSVQGGSLPVSFTWYSAKKENGALASVTVNKLEASHKIAEVRRDHQGGYYCVSDNAANESKQSPTVAIAGGCSCCLLLAVVYFSLTCSLLLAAELFCKWDHCSRKRITQLFCGFVSSVALQSHFNDYNTSMSEACPTKETHHKELTRLLLLGRIGDIELLQMCSSEILTCLQPTLLYVHTNIFPLWEFRCALFVQILRIKNVDLLRRGCWNVKFSFFSLKGTNGNICCALDC